MSNKELEGIYSSECGANEHHDIPLSLVSYMVQGNIFYSHRAYKDKYFEKYFPSLNSGNLSNQSESTFCIALYLTSNWFTV